MTSIRFRKLIARSFRQRPAARVPNRFATLAPKACCAAIALGLALPSGPALAAEDETKADPNRITPYVEYMVGASIVPNQTIRGADGSGANLWGSARPDLPGYFFGGAIGARFLEHFRSELQVGYRSTAIENIAVQSGISDSKGDLGLLSIMANGYFDWDLGVGVVPFVGVGIGWGMPRLDVQNKASAATQLSIDDTDSVFVWNAMVGGSYAISDVTDFSLGYRYIQTEDISYESKIGTTTPVARRLDFEYDAHEVYLGLRFNF